MQLTLPRRQAKRTVWRQVLHRSLLVLTQTFIPSWKPVLVLQPKSPRPVPASPMEARPVTSTPTPMARTRALLGARPLMRTLQCVIWTRALIALLHALRAAAMKSREQTTAMQTNSATLGWARKVPIDWHVRGIVTVNRGANRFRTIPPLVTVNCMQKPTLKTARCARMQPRIQTAPNGKRTTERAMLRALRRIQPRALPQERTLWRAVWLANAFTRHQLTRAALLRISTHV